MSKRLVSTSEAAKRLGVSRWTVQRMIRDGRLTTVHNPVRAHDKIPVEQVDEMLEVV